MELLDFFLLRTPLFPVSNKFHDPVEVFTENEQFRESIILSSPSLYNDAILLIKNKIVSDKEKLKIRLSLLRYLKRMSFRCTPFGTSAGIAIGGITKQTRISISNPQDSTRLVRPDMSFLGHIYQAVLKDMHLRKRLLFSRNNTLIEVHNEIRYYEYTYEPYRTYKISSVESEAILALIFSFSEYPVSHESLLKVIISEGYEPLEADDFIDQLITSKLLISDLEPSVSGTHYGKKLLTFLNNNKSYLVGYLDKARLMLEDIYSINISKCRNDFWYKKMISDAETIGIKDVDLVQVDLLKEGSQIELDREIFKDLTVALQLTKVLVGRDGAQNLSALRAFIEEFETRYEGMEIPLLEILDTQIGIGYPYSLDSETDDYLTEDLGLETYKSESFEISKSFNHILRKYYDCINQRETEIVLTQEDLGEKKENENNVAYENILSSLVSVIGNHGFTKIFHTSTESVGLKPLGRFIYAHPQIQSYLEELTLLEQEHQTNEIMAEVVFLPEDRVGNLITKPSIGNYEIPIIGHSSLPVENQIRLYDIFVSVVNGEIQLKSKRLNKIVKPVFTSAYTHTKSNVPIFRFLCDLQYQHKNQSITWDWGVLGRMPFLPRVSYKNIILSKATWKIRFESIAPLLKMECSKDKIEQYFIRNRMPNSFIVIEGDHALPIQLCNEDSYLLFMDELKKKGLLVIQESLVSDEKDCVVIDTDKRGYMNEVILLWSNNKKSKQKVEVPKAGFSVDKLLPAGGLDFIYFKIYCNNSMADNIIKNHIAPWFDKLEMAGISFTWFFIRYADPQFHLRIRIFSTEENILKIRANFPIISSLVNKHKKSWKIQEDTYNPEWQRYGKENMKNVEEYFFVDSKFVLRLICELSFFELQSLRWKIALLTVNSVLDDFSLSVYKKAELINTMEMNFLNEFKVTSKNKAGLAKKYRKSRAEIECVLLKQEANLTTVYRLLDERKEQLKVVGDRMNRLIKGNELGVNLFDLISSLIHMSLNRIFENKHRLHEMVIYSFLSYHYKSEIARAEHNVTPMK